MNMLLSGDRCPECRGEGSQLYFKPDGTEIPEKCEDCRGTGREMSDLCRELFDTLDEFFVITRKPR
jgi:DnaJ-class molecular chaperone